MDEGIIISPYYLFVLSSGILDDMEYGCYTKWFDHIVLKDPPKVDLIGECIYSLTRYVCDPLL